MSHASTSWSASALRVAIESCLRLRRPRSKDWPLGRLPRLVRAALRALIAEFSRALPLGNPKLPRSSVSEHSRPLDPVKDARRPRLPSIRSGGIVRFDRSSKPGISERLMDGARFHSTVVRVSMEHNMKREIRVFDDLAAADEADRREYASLTPEQRVEILLDLVARYRESLGEAAEGFERVYRVIELSGS